MRAYSGAEDQIGLNAILVNLDTFPVVFVSSCVARSTIPDQGAR